MKNVRLFLSEKFLLRWKKLEKRLFQHQVLSWENGETCFLFSFVKRHHLNKNYFLNVNFSIFLETNGVIFYY
jgi:hypothetical protein